MLSDVSSSVVDGVVVLRMDDILAEEERHLVLLVELPALQSPEMTAAFEVEIAYTRLEGGATRLGTAAMTVSIDRVEELIAQPRPNVALDVIVAHAQLLQAQLVAEALANLGRYQQAVLVLRECSSDLSSRGHLDISTAAVALEGAMMDERTYVSSSAMRKSLESGMKRGTASGREAESQALLDAMGKKTRTQAQQDMEASFAGSDARASADDSAGSAGSGPRRRPPSKPTPKPKPGGGGTARQRSKRW